MARTEVTVSLDYSSVAVAIEVFQRTVTSVVAQMVVGIDVDGSDLDLSTMTPTSSTTAVEVLDRPVF